MSLDPEMLMAYADGELGPVEAKRVEQAIAEDPALAQEVARHRALRETLGARFKPIIEEPVPDRLVSILKSNVVILSEPGTRAAVPGWARWGGAIAASLVLGLAMGHGLRDPGYVRTQGGQLYAAGGLASALDKQLAGDPGAVRTPVSFRDAEGSYCRVFTSSTADGVACHGTQGWALRQTRPGSTEGKAEYTQAGSADPALMAAAQEMMAGEPLDASAEVRARATGWQGSPR